jgi:hypothetical protein
MTFMSREVSFAFPQRQRQLIEMILFKTLASSPQALASTLRTMRQRLITLRDGLPTPTDEALVDALTIDDDFDVESLLEEIDDADTDVADTPTVQGRLLAAELGEIDSLIERADNIITDSKSQALLRGLDAAFNRLKSVGAQRKALVFTESRKTQAFLAAYLEANGYAGKVVTFNGSNTHPSAKIAYDRFVAKHKGTDNVTGSKAVDIRSALIEDFRDRADILLATEAAAEGVNLQFCSLVVNYDLPWNPQRIEQRIGRCHRYGQQHDVVVVNFLSQDNVADRRVQDLLQQKFTLFDGLFGASDEVLGAIEDGVDFEKRVLDILKNCRTDAEIEQAFNALQIELESTISQKMTHARQQLFEHFDVDVTERLKMRGTVTGSALDKVGERFWRLTQWALDGAAVFDDQQYSFDLPNSPVPGVQPGRYRLISAARSDSSGFAAEAHLLRLSSPIGLWILERAKGLSLHRAIVVFDVSRHEHRISMLRSLIGQSGWLRLDKLTLNSDSREEFLLLTGMNDSGVNIEQERLQRLFDVSGNETGVVTLGIEEAQRIESDAQRLAQSTLTVAGEASDNRARQIRTQIDDWADDKLIGAEEDLAKIKREIRAARRNADIAETIQLRREAEEAVVRLERIQRQKRQAIFDLEDNVEKQRLELVDSLKKRIEQRSERVELFTIRWKVV